MKYNIIPKIIGLVSVAVILSMPQYSEAVSVNVNSYSTKINTGQFRVSNNPFTLVVSTRFNISLSKEFNLIKTANSYNLKQSGDNIIVGDNITGVNSPAIGSFTFVGSSYATPPMDNSLHYSDYIATHRTCRSLYTIGNVPHWGSVQDEYVYALSSNNNNVLDCSNQNCTAKKSGDAIVTVSWRLPDNKKGNYILNRGRAKFSSSITENCGEFRSVTLPEWTSGPQSFKLSQVSYSIKVVDKSNNAPQVTNVRAEDIGFTNATIKWDYTDTEGDLQSISQVQVSKNSSFSDIAYDSSSTGVNTSRSVTGLVADTTYYVRVKATDNKNSINTQPWVEGAQFKTKSNNAPQVTNVRAEDIGFTNATIKWDYTDTEGDLQSISRVQVSKNSSFSDIAYDSNSTGVNTSRAVTDLVVDTTYYVRVKATDNNNSIDTQPWVEGAQFKTNAYSDVSVVYSATSGNTTVQKGESLNTVTGDNIKLQWNITDQDGGKVEALIGTCEIKADNILGGQAFPEIEAGGLGLNGNKSSIVPTSKTDQRYNVRLICPAQTGATGVNESITVEVKSKPSISCSINGNTTVDSDNPKIQISGSVTNSDGPYILEYKRSTSEAYRTVPGESGNTITNLEINYSGLGLGRYNPWLKVTKPGTTLTAEASCGTVTNLGTSTIKEGS